MKSLTNTKITALYGRLSQEDEQEGDSISVINQKKILEDYARRNGFQNLRYYSDDGYTGTNFNRPGFQKMMKDIEHGEVSTVIVKDMSRLGRNYLEVGYYTEVLFPSKGVRFLAINNGIDSNNPRENEFAPFINIMNEWYARDTSNKIRAVFNNRMQDGKRCSGAVPYGYMKKPDDKQTFFIDPEAAPVVRRIFEMTAEGYGPQQIVDILREERILCPAAHSEKNGLRVNSTRSNDYAWSIMTIHRILDQKQYLGHTVLHKSVKDNFKTKIPHKVDEEDQYVFLNTHEAIISQDLWDQAQSLRVKKANTPMTGKVSHRLSGLVYCSECGSKLFYSSCEWKERMGEVLTIGARYFQCSGVHRKATSCKSHHIPAVILENAVEDAIHGIIRFALKDETEFAAKVMEQWQKEKGKESSFEENEYKRLLKRNDELSLLISKLFESTQLGTLPERQAQRMIVQYDEEQAANEEKLKILEKTLAKRNSVKADPKRFIELVRKYKDCADISDAMLYAFIDKIIVHEADERLKPFKYKKIDIYFNFIGNFLTEPEPSLKELKAELERLDFEKKVEAKKRYAETKKAKRKKLAELSEADPEAFSAYEEYRKTKSEISARHRKKLKERAEADPQFAEELQRKRDEYNQREMEIRREVARQVSPISPRAQQRAWDEAHPEEAALRKAEKQREYWRSHDMRRKEKAASDPVLQEEFNRRQRERNAKSWEKKKQRMAEDPEYAAEQKRKKAESRKKQYEAHKARMATDPDYAAAYKAKQSAYRKTWADKQEISGPTSEEKDVDIGESTCAS